MKNLGPLFYLLLSLCYTNNLLAQPTNDSLANAIVLGNNSFPNSSVVTTGEAQAATSEANEIICESATASWWYAFTPTVTTAYIIKSEVLGSSAGDDIRLGIYTGSTHPLTEVLCADKDNGDGDGEDELVSLTANTTYYIRVAPDDPSMLTGDVTTAVAIFNTWEGDVSDDWSDAANWSLNTVPTATSLVQILGSVPNEPVIKNGVNATASYVALLEDRSLTIDNGGTLTVAGEEEDGIFMDDANSALTIKGTLNVSNSEDGIDVEDGTLIVSTAGVVTITNVANGIEFSGENIHTISGQVDISNIAFVGIVLQESVTLTVDESATVNISFTGLDGFLFINETDLELNINGTVTVEEVTDDGIDVRGTLNVGKTGTVSISKVGDNGIEDLVGTNAGQITISDIEDEGIDTGNDTFTNQSTGIIDLSDTGQDCIDVDNLFVNEGLVIADDCGTIVISDGIFNNNANAILRAAGLIGASSTVFADSSILEVGTSLGCITFSAEEDFSNAVLRFEIEGTNICTEYDNIEVGGAPTLTNTTLELSGAYDPQLGDEFVIIQNDNTTDPVVGTFAGLSEGSTFFFNNAALSISYVGGNGNDVVLTTVEVYECMAQITFEDETVAAGIYRSASTITTTGTVDLVSNAEISFVATDSIILGVGFTTAGVDEFKASITACTVTNNLIAEERNEKFADAPRTEGVDFQIYPNPLRGDALLEFDLSVAEPLRIALIDINGKYGQRLANRYFSKGPHQLSLPTAHLVPGIYFLQIQTKQSVSTHRIVVQ
ncbi:MAG: T9SS type A sorting domain-containing protein [Bacteroidota bacterium]